MTWAFPPNRITSIPVTGTDEQFPVRRVYCVGRNYAEHAREMGADPEREPPFFFCKPADAVRPQPESLPYPTRTSILHHEVELVVAIGKSGSDISANSAAGFVFGLAVGVDLTRRDLQQQAKDLRRPWDTGKAFDDSAPVSELQPVTGALPEAAGIWLNINGRTRQSSDINQMIWSVNEVIAELSTLFRLEPGDLVFTGTPAGVGPIERGDLVDCGIDGIGRLSFRIA